MARLGSKLILALEAEARAHQQVVNIGDELKTVQKARQQPMKMKFAGFTKPARR